MRRVLCGVKLNRSVYDGSHMAKLCEPGITNFLACLNVKLSLVPLNLKICYMHLYNTIICFMWMRLKFILVVY